MKRFFCKFCNKLNVAGFICDHLIDDNHTKRHQMIVGAIIMVLGVSLVKLCAHVNHEAIVFLGDISGYGIHGVGTIPFVKTLTDGKG